MKIISGRFKGVVLKSREGIRPTESKIRKSLFDILGDLEGITFLDLFAGCGSVGIEALSRGAKSVVFVESNIQCFKFIRANLSILKGKVNTGLFNIDAFSAVELFHKREYKFDIIFIDPPYYGDLAKKILQKISSYDIVSPSALVIIQHYKKDILENTIDNFVLWQERKYSDTVLSFYKVPSEQLPVTS